MTREELERMSAYQAADAAYKYAGERCRKDRPISASKLEAFEAGAEWAQEFIIERACEWLELHINDDKYYSCIGEETLIPYLINDFKKAMEE